MDPVSLEQISRWAHGSLAASAPSDPVSAICTDSRSLHPGDLFLALRGESFDGHTFVGEAARRGALGAVVEEVPEGLPADFAIIRVQDTLRALQDIAASYRRALAMRVIGVTGSNGKTSTKDLTAAVLGEHFRVTKTAGNFNNHVGLPLSILQARNSDEIGVFELGMNHPGEIAPLAEIAAPDVAIITNVGVAHIEFMGSREAIAQEKGMLAEALLPSGTVILDAADDFSKSIAARTKADALFCGIDRGDIFATDLKQDFSGMKFHLHAGGKNIPAHVPVPGIHMVRNALFAVAAGTVFGLAIEECAAGLEKLQLSKGRLEMKIVRGIQIIDDSYNANPDSMKAALLTLAQMSSNGRRIAVLGRMAELGAQSEPGHREVGRTAADLGLDCVIAIGEEAAWIADEAWRGGIEKVLKFPVVEDSLKALREIAHAGDLILVKGSRSSRMERIVEGLNQP